ncbi:Ankyrin repeat protein 1 [Giardia muris]|uniref:Ankyrin repeat protein 1 n=1 Tax=Giardia muris TaxID=5742 RepID=A0A4Z1T3G9_GIAMU|nr:Ankyrin repeat protein 1 [Giardia muris]|eukprot:TNJ28503.1 Ankyrin repeat protein 1 [Giardia muris]
MPEIAIGAAASHLRRTRDGTTDLMLAAKSGDITLLNQHLDQLGRQNNLGKSALMYAAEEGFGACLEPLLPEAGLTTRSGACALSLAIAREHPACVRLLSSQRSECAHLDPLLTAVLKRDVEALKRHQGQPGRQQPSALILAAMLGYDDCIRELTDELGRQNMRGETALMIAIKHRHLHCVDLLLTEAGMEARNKTTALGDVMSCAIEGVAVPAGLHECAQKLLPLESGLTGYTELMVDAVFGLDLSAYPSTAKRHQTKKGETALMLAVRANKLEFIDSLIPAESRMQDNKGETALMYAVRTQNLAAVKKLAKPEKCLRNNAGEPALLLAVRHFTPDDQGFELLQILLELELKLVPHLLDEVVALGDSIFIQIAAQFNLSHSLGLVLKPRKPVEGLYGRTELMVAALEGNVDGIRMHLGQIGQSYRNETALSLAVGAGHEECVKLLLQEAGLRLWNGKTALMAAAETNNVAMVRLLLIESGLQDNDGKSALMYACIAGHRDAAYLLLHETGLQDERGLTATMHGAINVKANCVQLTALKEPRMVDKGGRTALMHAVQGPIATPGHPAMTQVGSLLTMTESASVLARSCAIFLLHEAGMYDNDGLTALHHALYSASTECISILLEMEQSLTRITNLMISACQGSLTRIQRNRQQLQCQDTSGKTALMYAVIGGQFECARFLLESEAKMTANNGETALMLAVRLGQEKMVGLLVEAEAGLLNADGDTALMIAIKQRHPTIPRLLALEMMTPTRTGKTAFELALELSNIRAYAYLAAGALTCFSDDSDVRIPLLPIRNSQVTTRLMEAALADDHGMIEEAIDQAGTFCNGETALMLAARTYDIDDSTLLLCEARLANLQGWTAIMFAAFAGRRESVRCLAPCEVGISGFTHLMAAAAMDDTVEIHNFIHEAGQTDTAGNTALVYAACGGCKAAIELLLKHEAKAHRGRLTPLMCAASNGHAEVISLLLSEANEVDVLGYTALMYAAKQGHVGCVRELLVERGHYNEFGLNAYTIARKEGHIECADLLNSEVL